MHTVTKTGN